MSRSMLILSGIFPPDVGGPAKFANVFSQWLSEEEWGVKVISLSDSGHGRKLLGRVEVSLISRKISLIKRYLLVIKQIYKDSRTFGLILANGLFIELWITSKIFGVSYCVKVPGDIVWERAKNQSVTSRGVDEFQSESINWKYRLFRELYSRSLRDATHVIVPSQHLFDLCELWGVPKSRIHLIHNSVFVDEFESIDLNKDFDLLTVARLVKWKGIDEIIRVCGENKLSLLVVGDGPEMQNLNEVAKSSNASVSFAGDVAQEILPSYYSRSRAFVLNSNFEASSYSLLEAMACSLPVIASRKTGSSEVVRDSIDGYLIDEYFPLGEAVPKLLANPKLAAEMGRNARERIVENFNSELNFKRIANLLSEDSI
jgi:glycosyltransferase involved in cell wall biosynthesis